MIKVITGIRKRGKSRLLFVLFKRHLLDSGVKSDHVMEIALDSIANEASRDPKRCCQLMQERMKDGGRCHALQDEVRFMPRFEGISSCAQYDIGRKEGRASSRRIPGSLKEHAFLNDAARP